MRDGGEGKVGNTLCFLQLETCQPDNILYVCAGGRAKRVARRGVAGPSQVPLSPLNPIPTHLYPCATLPVHSGVDSCSLVAICTKYLYAKMAHHLYTQIGHYA
jgi:hypothetical protein